MGGFSQVVSVESAAPACIISNVYMILLSLLFYFPPCCIIFLLMLQCPSFSQGDHTSFFLSSQAKQGNPKQAHWQATQLNQRMCKSFICPFVYSILVSIYHLLPVPLVLSWLAQHVWSKTERRSKKQEIHVNAAVFCRKLSLWFCAKKRYSMH